VLLVCEYCVNMLRSGLVVCIVCVMIGCVMSDNYMWMVCVVCVNNVIIMLALCDECVIIVCVMVLI